MKDGTPWTGNGMLNPINLFGRFSRADGHWAGWVHAVDADTGVWKWRVKTNYPILSGMTPTAGGLVFFGDMGGNFYALDRDRPEAVGPEDRRRDRRRRHHLHRGRGPEGRGSGRHDVTRLAGAV